MAVGAIGIAGPHLAASEAQALTDLEAAQEHHRQHPGRPADDDRRSSPAAGSPPPAWLPSGSSSVDGTGFFPWLLAPPAGAADDVRWRHPWRRQPQVDPTWADPRAGGAPAGSATAGTSVSAGSAPGPLVPSPVPRPDRDPPWLIAGVEVGRAWWHPHSATDGSGAAGGLGARYGVDYRIDPVDTVGVNVLGVMGDWVVGTAYSGSTGPELAQLASGGLGFLIGDAALLSDAEWGKVQGEAGTVDSAGARVAERIDTTWRRADLMYNDGTLSVGLEVERLALPSTYSLDDQGGQVVAVFDPTTAWTTASLVVEAGNRIPLLLTRVHGLHPQWKGRLGIGFGELTYDHATVASLARRASYELDAASGVVRLLGELELGAAYQVPVGAGDLQFLLAGRLRGNWYRNLDREPGQRDPDHLTLVSELDLVTAGVVVGVTGAW